MFLDRYHISDKLPLEIIDKNAILAGIFFEPTKEKNTGTNNAGVPTDPKNFHISMTESKKKSGTTASRAVTNNPTLVYFTVCFSSILKICITISLEKVEAATNEYESTVDITVASIANAKRPNKPTGRTSKAIAGYEPTGFAKFGRTALAYIPQLVVKKSKNVQQAIEIKIPFLATLLVLAA